METSGSLEAGWQLLCVLQSGGSCAAGSGGSRPYGGHGQEGVLLPGPDKPQVLHHRDVGPCLGAGVGAFLGTLRGLGLPRGALHLETVGEVEAGAGVKGAISRGVGLRSGRGGRPSCSHGGVLDKAGLTCKWNSEIPGALFISLNNN